jgi:hypothetical protein
MIVSDRDVGLIAPLFMVSFSPDYGFVKNKLEGVVWDPSNNTLYLDLLVNAHPSPFHNLFAVYGTKDPRDALFILSRELLFEHLNLDAGEIKIRTYNEAFSNFSPLILWLGDIASQKKLKRIWPTVDAFLDAVNEGRILDEVGLSTYKNELESDIRTLLNPTVTSDHAYKDIFNEIPNAHPKGKKTNVFKFLKKRYQSKQKSGYIYISEDNVIDGP